MNAEEFRRHGRQMVDYIADYMENIRDREVVHRVSPGYLRGLLPKEAPQNPENFDEVFKDVEKYIMPGITHWHSPYFHGYFAAGNSYPSILGDMLSDAIGCIGFSWATSPACTELEVITTDWLGKMIGLPPEFLHSSPGPGGGVIQSTASETVFLCVLAARTKMVAKYKAKNPAADEMTIISKLVGYSSDQANSSVHRSGLLGAVRMVKLPSDKDFSLRGDTLREAIEKDKADGYIPFFLCASLGTTGSCAFDNLTELGPICEENDMWLHIDAAYAGSAFVCPEYRKHMEGIEAKLHVFDGIVKDLVGIGFYHFTTIKNSSYLVDAFNVDPIYLRHENEGRVPDYRHWQIPLGRRFRSLKLWFMLRSYGVKGVQEYIRRIDFVLTNSANPDEMSFRSFWFIAGLTTRSKDIKRVNKLAKEFEAMVQDDDRFEVVVEVVMGLVCFRLKGDNFLSEKLYDEILEDGRIYLIPAISDDLYFLRFAICAERTTSDDVKFSFDVIKTCADRILKKRFLKNGLVHTPLIDIDASPKRLHNSIDSLHLETDQ